LTRRRRACGLIESGPRVLSTFPESLSAAARRQLEHLGVEVQTGTPVSEITAEGYRLGDVFVPREDGALGGGCRGVAARCVTRRAARSRRARAGAARSHGPGHSTIFVAGDLASLQQDGKPVPGVAPAAKQMGAHVARVIRARLRGAAPPAFRYRDYGNLATIGRMAAVVDLHGFKLSGILAWWFWLSAHVFFLIGFRNRIIVLINWAWAYFTYQRAARIVLGADATGLESGLELEVQVDAVGLALRVVDERTAELRGGNDLGQVFLVGDVASPGRDAPALALQADTQVQARVRIALHLRELALTEPECREEVRQPFFLHRMEPRLADERSRRAA
jgi:hypothetical protein